MYDIRIGDVAVLATVVSFVLTVLAYGLTNWSIYTQICAVGLVFSFLSFGFLVARES